MSAVIYDFAAIHSVRADDAVQRAAAEIRKALGGCDESRICQAIARAERRIRAGGCKTFAVHAAVSWARYATPEPPMRA